MKRFLKGTIFFWVLNVFLITTCFAGGIKKLKPTMKSEKYTLTMDINIDNPEDLTQYYRYDIEKNIKWELELPNCEAILCADDSYIVYTGVQGNLYCAHRKNKKVIKLDFIGKHSYKKFLINIYKMEENYLFYSLKSESNMDRLKRANLETGEVTEINNELIKKAFLKNTTKLPPEDLGMRCLYENSLGAYVEFYWDKELMVDKWNIYLITWDGEIKPVLKCDYLNHYDGLVIKEDNILFNGLIYLKNEEYIPTFAIIDNKGEIYTFTLPKNMYNTCSVVGISGKEAILRYGSLYFKTNENVINVITEEDELKNLPPLDSHNYNYQDKYDYGVWDSLGIFFTPIYPDNINSVFRNEMLITNELVKQKNDKFDFFYIHRKTDDEYSDLIDLGFRKKEEYTLYIIEENILDSQYEYTRYFLKKDTIRNHYEIYYYKEKKNREKNYLWSPKTP